MSLSLFSRHRRKVLIIGGLVLLALLYALFAGGGEQAGGFRTVPVSRGDLVITVSATGNVQPTNQVDVGSEQSGTIAQLLVDENDRVKKGQLLARLDTAKLENAVARARASLASAEASVRQAKATVFENRTELERLRKVYELSGGKVPSATDLAAAEAALARAEANEASAQASVAEAQASLRSANTDLSKADIRSPINGVVLVRDVEVGQTVAASLQAPVLFTLAEDLARMELIVSIDEADVGKVAASMPATFTVDAWPNRVYPAKLTRVSYGSQTVSGVVTYEATLTVDNQDLSLRPGMTATATIDALRRDKVLLVPNAALRFTPASADGEQQQASSIVSKLMPRPPQQQQRKKTGNNKGANQRVYVLVNGQPQAVSIVVGESDGRMTEVVGGELAEGAQVITEQGSGAAPR